VLNCQKQKESVITTIQSIERTALFLYALALKIADAGLQGNVEIEFTANSKREGLVNLK